MTIQELQAWVANDWKSGSAPMPSVTLQILYLVEELGEVAEAIRKHESTHERVDKAAKTVDIGSEMADMLISLVTLANNYGVNLTQQVAEFQNRIEKRREKVRYS